MDKVDYEAKLAMEVAKLDDYRRALAEEHEKIKSEANDGAPLLDASAIAAGIEQKMLRAADEAAETVLDIMEHGDKDTTRLSAAKYVLDNIKDKVDPESDPWDLLLARIKKEEDAQESPADNPS